MQVEPVGFTAVFWQQRNDMLGPTPTPGGNICPAEHTAHPISPMQPQIRL